MNQIKKISFKILLIIFSFGVISSTFSVGMVTEPIIVKDALRGREVVKTITVFNPEKNKVTYSFGATGDVEGWAKFFEKNDLQTEITKTIVPANQYYDLITKIIVPKNTPNGKYAGEIFVKQEPQKSSSAKENTVTISQVVSRKIEITVSDKEIIGVKTTLIPNNYDFKVGDPLIVKIVYDNQGNVSVRPDLQIKITNTESEKAVFNATFSYSEDLEAVIPGEIKVIPNFEWQTTGQSNGSYSVEVKTLIDDEIIETDSFNFNIGTTISFGNNLFASMNSAGSTKWTVITLIIGLIFLIIAVSIRFISKKKSSKALPTKS